MNRDRSFVLKTLVGEPPDVAGEEDTRTEISTVRLIARRSETSYETLVFGGPLAGKGEGHASYEAALIGHVRWLLRVIEEEGLKPR